jgi:O-acetyl-ADP-ribose deacetylase (regulator of RNase III)
MNRVAVINADITTLRGDAIVNAANRLASSAELESVVIAALDRAVEAAMRRALDAAR